MKRNNIFIMGIPEERTKRTESIFKAIIAKTPKPGERNGHPDP